MAAAENENSGVSLSYPRCLKEYYAGIAPGCQKAYELLDYLKKAVLFCLFEEGNNVVCGLIDLIDFVEIDSHIVVVEGCMDLICTWGRR